MRSLDKMKLLNKTFSVFKKKFFKMFLINIVFAGVYLSFLVSTRKKILEYMQQLQTLTPGLEQLGGVLEQSKEAIIQLEEVLSKIGAINTKTLILFWAIPIATIVLWSVFQGVSWSTLTDNVKNLKNFLTNFFVASAVVFSLLFLLSYNTIFSSQSIFEVTAAIFTLNFLAYFLFFYFLYVYYAFATRGESIKKTLRNTFRAGILNCLILVPLFLPLFLLLTAITFIFFNAYTLQVIGTYDFRTILPWAAAFLVFLTAKIWYQVFFVLYLERY